MQDPLAPQATLTRQFGFPSVEECLAEFLNFRPIHVNFRGKQLHSFSRLPGLLSIIPFALRARIELQFSREP